MAATYGLYAHSHYQGTTDRLLAIGSREAVDHAEERLSTCSFCRPGRACGYSTGSCYDARRVGYARRGAPTLPPESVSWDRADLAAWLEDTAYDDCG